MAKFTGIVVGGDVTGDGLTSVSDLGQVSLLISQLEAYRDKLKAFLAGQGPKPGPLKISVEIL